LKDTQAVDILEKHVPGISRNPIILKSRLAMPPAKQSGMKDEMVLKCRQKSTPEIGYSASKQNICAVPKDGAGFFDCGQLAGDPNNRSRLA
jgi:hypothetical protein